MVTGVEGVYRRTGLFEARRAVMEDWVASLTAPVSEGAYPAKGRGTS